MDKVIYLLTNRKLACGGRFVKDRCRRVKSKSVKKELARKMEMKEKRPNNRNEVALMQCVLFPSPVHSLSCNHVQTDRLYDD